MGAWRIVKDLKHPLHRSLEGISILDYPYTVTFVIKRRLQIDSYMELPEDKRPPRCLDKMTNVFVKINGLIRRVSLIDLADCWNDILILCPGGWKKILNFEVNKQEALALRFARLDEIVCSLDHQFPLSNKKVSGTYLVRAEDIEIDKNYYKHCGLFKTIDTFLDELITEFNGRKLDYELGFFIGLYAAEGGGKFNRLLLTLNENESYIVDKIRPKLLEFGITEVPFSSRLSDGLFKCGKQQSDEDKKLLRVKISSRELSIITRYFVKGICRDKSLNDIFINCPLEFRRGLFDGLIEGDGRELDGNKFSFVSASKQLRDDLATVASSIGILTSKYEDIKFDRRYNNYSVGYLLHSRVGRNGETRKIDGNYQLPLTSKKLVGERELVDIEVEDSLFIINDGFVSHNSIWDYPSQLADWFDSAFSDGKKQNEFTLPISEDDVE